MDLSKREREGCRGYGGGHACGNAMMLVAMMLVVSGWRLEMTKKNWEFHCDGNYFDGLFKAIEAESEDQQEMWGFADCC